jgi:hypothetical protein
MPVQRIESASQRFPGHKCSDHTVLPSGFDLGLLDDAWLPIARMSQPYCNGGNIVLD